MKVNINSLECNFPFKTIYKEQVEYMNNLKEVIDAGGHGLIEMPTGSGKTVSFFSLVVSYQQQFPEKLKKIVYCTRTLSQLEKATEELKLIEKMLIDEGKVPPKSTVLSARRNLCLHSEISKIKERERVDAQCRVAIKHEKCSYYKGYEEKFASTEVTKKAFNIEDILEFGQKNHMCPYFTARAISQSAEIVLCNYPYLFDENVNAKVLRDLPKESVVIVDEAHNLDEVCIDSKSFKIDKYLLDMALKAVDVIGEANEKATGAMKSAVEAEMQNMIKKIENEALRKQLESNSNVDIRKLGMVPGSIRKISSFISFLKRFTAFLQNFLRQKEVLLMTTTSFLNQMTNATLIDDAALVYASTRLNSLMDVLEIAEAEELAPLAYILQFGQMLAMYKEGFRVIYEPFFDTGKTIAPVLQLACLDASLGLKPILEKTNSVILTSGTLSPLPLYARVMGVNPFRLTSIQPESSKDVITPISISKANDQSPLSSEFAERGNSVISKNFGELLLELAMYVPDGIVTFFPSYSFLEETLADWSKSALLESVLKYKLVFVESRDQTATANALQSYKKAIEKGRGGIFLCVARGKVAEGVDFKDHLGRCALVIGIPFQFARSRALLSRIEFLEKNYGITQKQFLHFDAMKQVAQCLGRVVRGKSDYGLMILADRRYDNDKLNLLPLWIKRFLKPDHIELQTKIGVNIAKKFFISMERPEKDQNDLPKTAMEIEEN